MNAANPVKPVTPQANNTPASRVAPNATDAPDGPDAVPRPNTGANPGRRALLGLGAAALATGLAQAQGMGGMSGGMSGMAGMSNMGGAQGMAGARAAAPPAAAPQFASALPIPPELHGRPQADGSLSYVLRLAPGRSELVSGLSTPTWGYNGALLGPALRLPQGKRVRIQLHNALNQSTTTHWHGAHVPGRMDGGPQSLIQPGQTATVDFALKQPGATLWYHPHPDTRTGPHIYAGLAGLLLVDDGLDVRLNLPHRWGVDDLPVIVQDRRIGADGRLLYMTSMMDRMGMKGGRFLVNGREQPHVQVPAQWLRLRLVNASNARVYNFAFADGRAFHAVASDAGLLAAPVELRSLLLAPSERAEVLVDLRREQGKTLVLRSDSGAVVPGLSSMPMDADHWDHAGFDLLQLRVVAPSGAGGSLPQRLADIPMLQADAPPRRFSLQGMMGGMMGSGGSSGMRGMAGSTAPALPGPGGMNQGVGGEKLFSINHHHMDMRRIDQRLRLGSTEIWEVVNDGHMAHPFHYHSTSFQILSRNGAAPPAHERGWKDTVLVRHAETVRLIAHFGQPAGDAHPFMFHCHILEHEDNGMMGQFTVS
jgi:blue copper oxidase